jgi:hypothetical protein
VADYSRATRTYNWEEKPTYNTVSLEDSNVWKSTAHLDDALISVGHDFPVLTDILAIGNTAVWLANTLVGSPGVCTCTLYSGIQGQRNSVSTTSAVDCINNGCCTTVSVVTQTDGNGNPGCQYQTGNLPIPGWMVDYVHNHLYSSMVDGKAYGKADTGSWIVPIIGNGACYPHTCGTGLTEYCFVDDHTELLSNPTCATSWQDACEAICSANLTTPPSVYGY